MQVYLRDQFLRHLFLLYANDLPLSIKCFVLDLFSVDAILFSSDPSILYLTNRIDADLENFLAWLKETK